MFNELLSSSLRMVHYAQGKRRGGEPEARSDVHVPRRGKINEVVVAS
jgi:hypothetical protein